jgi:hypothetical protein
MLMKPFFHAFRSAAATLLVAFIAVIPTRGEDSREVTDLKNRLAVLQQDLAENHPLIKTLHEEIAIAEKRDAGEAARLKASMLNIDFAGGSFEQLIAQINEGRPAPLNVIAEKSHLSLKLPAFKLRGASVRDLAVALDQLLAPQGVSLVFSQSDSNYAPIFVTRTIPGNSAQSRRTFECIDISGLLEGVVEEPSAHKGRQKVYTLDELESVVQSAWRMHTNAELPSDFRTLYNKETYLLLISGPRETVDVAMIALTRLPKPLKTR